MKRDEALLVEAINSMFRNDSEILGIVKGGKPTKEVSHVFQFQYENIRDMFALKVADSMFYESLTSAFFNIHSYKYLDDPTFTEALTKQLSAIGTPKAEIERAVSACYEVMKEMKGEAGLKDADPWHEKMAGWNPDMKGIRQVSQEFNTNRDHTNEPFTGGGFYPVVESLFKSIFMRLTGDVIIESKSPVEPYIKLALAKIASKNHMIRPDELAQIANLAHKAAAAHVPGLSPVDVMANSGELGVALFNALHEIRREGPGSGIRPDLKWLQKIPDPGKDVERFREAMKVELGSAANRAGGPKPPAEAAVGASAKAPATQAAGSTPFSSAYKKMTGPGL